MNGSIGILTWLVATFLASGVASAHAPGSPPITQSGSFELGPDGQANATFHVFLTDLGIPPDRGDTLQVSWSANAGLGPAIAFDIHAHRDAAEDVLYQASAIRVDDSWVVPATEAYMVRWSNPNPERVNVTYRLQLIAPVDLSALIVINVIVAAIVLLLVVSRRRPRPPT
jgi:hypothetical protein